MQRGAASGIMGGIETFGSILGLEQKAQALRGEEQKQALTELQTKSALLEYQQKTREEQRRMKPISYDKALKIASMDSYEVAQDLKALGESLGVVPRDNNGQKEIYTWEAEKVLDHIERNPELIKRIYGKKSTSLYRDADTLDGEIKKLTDQLQNKDKSLLSDKREEIYGKIEKLKAQKVETLERANNLSGRINIAADRAGVKAEATDVYEVLVSNGLLQNMSKEFQGALISARETGVDTGWKAMLAEEQKNAVKNPLDVERELGRLQGGEVVYGTKFGTKLIREGKFVPYNPKLHGQYTTEQVKAAGVRANVEEQDWQRRETARRDQLAVGELNKLPPKVRLVATQVYKDVRTTGGDPQTALAKATDYSKKYSNADRIAGEYRKRAVNKPLGAKEGIAMNVEFEAARVPLEIRQRVFRENFLSLPTSQ